MRTSCTKTNAQKIISFVTQNFLRPLLQMKFQKLNHRVSLIRLLTQIYVWQLAEIVIMNLIIVLNTVAVANIVAVTAKNDAVLNIVILFATLVMSLFYRFSFYMMFWEPCCRNSDEMFKIDMLIYVKHFILIL